MDFFGKVGKLFSWGRGEPDPPAEETDEYAHLRGFQDDSDGDDFTGQQHEDEDDLVTQLRAELFPEQNRFSRDLRHVDEFDRLPSTIGSSELETRLSSSIDTEDLQTIMSSGVVTGLSGLPSLPGSLPDGLPSISGSLPSLPGSLPSLPPSVVFHPGG